jgi:putative resolvase
MNGQARRRGGGLPGPGVQAVVAGHRDWLGRMDTEMAGAALSADGRRLVVLDSDEVDDDLVRDVAEVLRFFRARRYDRRSARNQAEKMPQCAAWDVGPTRSQVVP